MQITPQSTGVSYAAMAEAATVRLVPRAVDDAPNLPAASRGGAGNAIAGATTPTNSLRLTPVEELSETERDSSRREDDRRTFDGVQAPGAVAYADYLAAQNARERAVSDAGLPARPPVDAAEEPKRGPAADSAREGEGSSLPLVPKLGDVPPPERVEMVRRVEETYRVERRVAPGRFVDVLV
ncbi:MAG: hypothetical protein AAGI30_10315 [Planctomycetota bacterium]